MTLRPYYTATERCGCGATITVDAYTTDDLRTSLIEWRATHRHTVPIFSRDTPATELLVGDSDPESSRPERELLGNIWLYVSFESITRNLTLEQKELWADCIDGWEPDPDNPEAREPIERWWR